LIVLIANMAKIDNRDKQNDATRKRLINEYKRNFVIVMIFLIVTFISAYHQY
jgi:hypothetical protein